MERGTEGTRWRARESQSDVTRHIQSRGSRHDFTSSIYTLNYIERLWAMHEFDKARLRGCVAPKSAGTEAERRKATLSTNICRHHLKATPEANRAHSSCKLGKSGFFLPDSAKFGISS